MEKQGPLTREITKDAFLSTKNAPSIIKSLWSSRVICKTYLNNYPLHL